MLESILVAGAGGQGIVFIGRTMAAAAAQTVPHVTFFPAYGAEVRGGTSNCQVILSSEEIASPVADEFDCMLIMNQISLDRFLPQRKPDGIVVVDTSLCDAPADPYMAGIAATELANRLGDVRVANVVVFGAFLAARQIISPVKVEEAIRQFLAKKASSPLVDLNIKALHLGISGGKL